VTWLRSSWPPFSNDWDLPFGTLTDLIGIGVGLVVLCFTVWVALRQIQIMKRQTAMMEEQGRLSKRQTDLAETQNEIVQEQLARHPSLHFVMFPRNMTNIEERKTIDYDIYISNVGSRKTDGFQWHFFLPIDSQCKFDLADIPHESRQSTIGWEEYAHYLGQVEKPMFRRELKLIGKLSCGVEDLTVLRWHIVADEGEWPALDEYASMPVNTPEEHFLTFIAHRGTPGWKHTGGGKAGEVTAIPAVDKKAFTL